MEKIFTRKFYLKISKNCSENDDSPFADKHTVNFETETLTTIREYSVKVITYWTKTVGCIESVKLYFISSTLMNYR